MLASAEKLSTTKDAYINMVASFVTNSREKQSVSYAYSPFASRTEFQETRTITWSLIIHNFKVILPEIADTKESALCRTICSAAEVITALLRSFQKLIILDPFFRYRYIVALAILKCGKRKTTRVGFRYNVFPFVYILPRAQNRIKPRQLTT